MFTIKLNDLTGEIKSTISVLNKLSPIKANDEIQTIHKYFLGKVSNFTDHLRKISPFSLFNQKAPSVNPLSLSIAQLTPLTDKISAIGQPTTAENPLQDFIRSLSAKTQPLPTSQQFSAEILGISTENKDFITLRLKRPKEWEFLPGQYLEIRSESSSATKPAILAVASGIHEDYIEITAKPNANPTHANYCLNGTIGDYLTVTGPLGSNFPFGLITPETPVLVLGGGSGLTALKSVMDSLPLDTEAKLFYSSKTVQELIYRDEIEQWKADGHTISLTQDKVDGFQRGRITDHLANSEIKPNTLFFICGPKELVVGTAKWLADRGFPRESIYGSLPVIAKDGGPVFRGDHQRMIA